MFKKADIIGSLVIGEAAALLMLLIGRNLALPQVVRQVLPWMPLVFPFCTLAAMLVGAAVGRSIFIVYQFTKFLLVGGLNFLIDLGTLNLCIHLTGISQGFYANVFKAIAFLVAVTFSFFWNKFWTFSALSTEGTGRQFAQFFIVTGIGFFINVGTFAFLNDWVGPQAAISATTWASVAAAGAAVVGLIWNFSGYKFLVFRRSESRI